MPIGNRGAPTLGCNGYLVLIIVLGLLQGRAAAGQQQRTVPQPLRTLTKVHDVDNLTIDEAARNYPVRLTAVVTYYDLNADPRHPVFFASDASGSIYVSMRALPFQAGDLVEIAGVSAAGDYAPIVKGTEAHVIGKAPLPSSAPRESLAELLSGAEDGQWVEVEGVVQAVRESGKNISLDLALSDGAITANTTQEVGADYHSLVDAKIKLRGNQAPLFNHQLQMTGVHLFFPNRAQVTVEKAGPEHPLHCRCRQSAAYYASLPIPIHTTLSTFEGRLRWPGPAACSAFKTTSTVFARKPTKPLP